MTVEAYTLVGLTAALAALVAVLVYAVLRLGAAARGARARPAGERDEAAFVAAAIQEAVARLREDERKLQRRAEASERLSEEIVGGMGSGLVVAEPNGRLRLINPAARRILGIGDVPAEAAYRTVLAEAAPLVALIDEALHTGQPVVRHLVEIPPGPSRDRICLGVTVSPMAGPDNGPSAVVCLFSDLTAVVALEEEVRLKESLASLGELTAGLAHEFRNGLATIHGYARLIDAAALPPREATYLEGIRRETESLSAVVTNFLNFARPTRLTLAPVDIGALVSRVADEIRPDAERRGGAVAVEGAFAPVEGDEVLLRQALSNLCRNALEACADTGQPPAIRLAGAVDHRHGRVTVSVEDNGPGIDPARLGRIFQPFVTSKPDGTGLGLALAQKIAVTHNGRIRAANRAAGGAVFELTLPMTQRP